MRSWRTRGGFAKNRADSTISTGSTIAAVAPPTPPLPPPPAIAQPPHGLNIGLIANISLTATTLSSPLSNALLVPPPTPSPPALANGSSSSTSSASGVEHPAGVAPAPLVANGAGANGGVGGAGGTRDAAAGLSTQQPQTSTNVSAPTTPSGPKSWLVHVNSNEQLPGKPKLASSSLVRAADDELGIHWLTIKHAVYIKRIFEAITRGEVSFRREPQDGERRHVYTPGSDLHDMRLNYTCAMDTNNVQKMFEACKSILVDRALLKIGFHP